MFGEVSSPVLDLAEFDDFFGGHVIIHVPILLGGGIRVRNQSDPVKMIVGIGFGVAIGVSHLGGTREIVPRIDGGDCYKRSAGGGVLFFYVGEPTVGIVGTRLFRNRLSNRYNILRADFRS